MVIKPMLLFCCTAWFVAVVAQDKPAGIFKHTNDVGNPRVKGSSVYDKQTGTYTLSGGGTNIWFNRDEFHFAYNKLKGDFILTAQFEFLGEGKEPHRKTGWMVRTSTIDSAVHMSAVLHGDGLTVLQWRVKPGMSMRDPEDEIFAKGKDYHVLQLQRSGNVFIMRVAEKQGDPLQVVGQHTLENLTGEVLAGLFICSHNPGVSETAIIRNVSIKK